MEHTEEEQVEALKRWWEENGRSTIAGVAIALVAAFGWQGWLKYGQEQREAASDIYQQLLEVAAGAEQNPAQQGEAERLAARLRDEYAGSTYAQFAGLQLARLAVVDGDLDSAESALREVLAEADSGGDIALVAQQRLARVVAAKGDTDAALALLATPGGQNSYQASYALVRGDILLAAGRKDEALTAYQLARQLETELGGQVNLATLDQKLASLTPQGPAAPGNENAETVGTGLEADQ